MPSSPATRRRRTPAKPVAVAALIACALTFSACGGDDQASTEGSLPDRPKLTIPNGSVAQSKSSKGSTEPTGATSDSTDSQTSAGTQTGGTTTQTGTGGAGTGTGTQGGTQNTAPQNTGGAGPGQ